VAVKTGTSVRDVLEESYALTLWTYIELREQRRHEALIARGDRLDLAGLFNLASYNVDGFKAAHREYVAEVTGQADAYVAKEAALLERVRAMAAAQAAKRAETPQPTEPDPEPVSDGES
jgi:hypothetical protein